MDTWLILLLAFFSFLLHRLISNYSKFRAVSRLENEYTFEYVAKKKGFVENSEHALELFKEAGLKDGYTSIQVSTGMAITISGIGQDKTIPQYKTQSISVFENITYYDGGLITTVQLYFQKAKGVFKRRMQQSLSPLFWIELLLKFPIYILEYLDFTKYKTVTNIIQLIWWSLGIVKLLTEFKIIDLGF